MDDSESASLQFLKAQGFQNIVYEPDGNLPPDFVVESRIAVEVRRLNQHKLRGSQPVALENLRFSLRDRISKLLKSLGPPDRQQSWFFGFRFRRPAPNWERIEPALLDWLRLVAEERPSDHYQAEVLRGFVVWVFPCSHPQEDLFVLGGFIDRDAGGFTIANVVENLPICVSDKEGKLLGRRSLYNVWWLILVDHIAGHLDDDDRKQLTRLLVLSSWFDRIVLINPSNPASHFDVPYNRLGAS